MERQTARQVQGAVDLLHDATTTAANTIGAIQVETADLTYTILKQIPVVTGPAAAIERFHLSITRGVYVSVRGVSTVVALATAFVLARLPQSEQE